MTLAQLRTFHCIVRLGSFYAAAQELGISQPSVSQRVRELERALETELFIRHGPRVTLTAEGHALIDHAERLLEGAEGIVARFRGRDPLRGVLRLGLNESFAFVCLAELLQRLQQRYPDLTTSIHVGDTGAVSRLLNERKLDVGIVSHPDLEPHVAAQPLGVNEFAWIASAAVEVPPGALTPADVARLHLAISPPSARLHATAMAWFARAGVAPKRLSTCNNLTVTRLTILNGIATGLVPVKVMQEELARGTVKRLPLSVPIPGHLVSLCHQASEFGPGLQQVLELIRSLVASHRLFT
ncbi:MAG: LysR family transcriptional regulator [Acetobacteraceae bacterium]